MYVTINAQDFLPLIKKVKPESGKHNNFFVIGFIDNNTYHTIGVSIDGNKSKIECDVPYLIIPGNNHFIYALQNETLTKTEIDTSEIFDKAMPLPQYESDDIVVTNYYSSIEQAEANVKDSVIEDFDYDGYWYNHSYSSINCVANNFINVQLGGDSYTGGAHPNWFETTGVKILDENDLNSVLDDVDENGMLNTSFVQANNMFQEQLGDSLANIQRYLFFKGIDGFWDDSFNDENDSASFDIHQHDGEIMDSFSNQYDFYIPNVEDLNFFLFHDSGEVRYGVQAFASASYVESGDYQFTVSKDLGALPDSLLPNNKSALTLSEVVAFIPCYDFYLSPDHQFLITIKDDDAPNTQIITLISLLNGKIILQFKTNNDTSPIMGEWLDNNHQTLLKSELLKSKKNFVNGIVNLQ